ncbi:unconventional myosin-Id [Trichonephila inaurata madagascariensis]|uniref:Unconventional myosin-Id n=1 Tax=Trichonephila inaurata madagascariensis TaxID=2747483 RepID=A0A8X7CK06_9ARAC|nr:unconventional myosin-Id [Trichonephila inaurata madagascariensis]
MEKVHTVSEAVYGRDAFAKAIYERLFSFIVSRINEAIEIGSNGHGLKKNNTVMGVLDIYGFEIFESNSFEQFCINYCNEKLQQLFIELVLKQEQEEYRREGITWQNVDYFNNAIICTLIDEAHKGIFAIADEACLSVGKITDEMLIEAMDNKLASHKHYTSRKVAPTDKTLEHRRDFRIKHYAGDVTYSITGFMEKNMDSLYQDFKRLMYCSADPLISEMWPDGDKDITQVTKRPLTAGTLFKNSMVSLVKNLGTKEPYYVRCIKPNDQKSPALFDDTMVEHQVAYLGLLENVRVRRAGFAYRQTYNRFLRRYKMISKYTWPNFRGGSEKDGCRVLIDEQGFSDDVRYGTTKIFIQSPQTISQLEYLRLELIPGIVVFLQKMWRGAIARLRYRKMLAMLTIIKFYRHQKLRKYIDQVNHVFRYSCHKAPHQDRFILAVMLRTLLNGHDAAFHANDAKVRAYREPHTTFCSTVERFPALISPLKPWQKASSLTGIYRFGVPAIITTDQEGQFQSRLLYSLKQMLGIQRIRTTPYHPSSNGMVERLNRTLKQAIRCHNTKWTESLPVVLLGLRACIKEDLNASLLK